jgi:hypothetical protein
MHVSEDPRAWGFDREDEIVRGGTMALYRAREGSRAFLSGAAAAYARAAGSLRQRLDSLQVQDLTHGDYQRAQPGAPLTLYISDQRLSWTPIEGPQLEDPHELTLDLSSQTAQNVILSWPSQQQAYAVPQGASRIVTPPLGDDVTALQISVDSAPLVVRSAQLFDAAGQNAGVQPLSDTLTIATATRVEPAALQTTILATSGLPNAIHAELEIYEISERTPRRYAGGALALRANEPAALRLDLQQPAATLNGGAVPLTIGDLQDGRYFAALWIYQGSTLVRRVPFARFERQSGQVAAVESLDANATFARLALVGRTIDATIGPVKAESYMLTAQPRAGETAQLEIQWQVQAAAPEPLLVFAQILGPDDRKYAAWDGAAGGDWFPSPAWRAGDRIWQTIPLTIAPATPPGRYRLAIGLYRADTGERLPVSGSQAQAGLIVLEEIEIGP